MKKLIIILGLVAILMTLASCIKEPPVTIYDVANVIV